jgi:hypothetical protein
MNEKRKSEGELIDSIFTDDRTRSQRLLDKCKREERQKGVIPVKLDNKTTCLVPAGTDIEKWKRKKSRDLNKQYRHNDLPQENNFDVHG